MVGVKENASYYIFVPCPDRTIKAFPVNSWYSFKLDPKHTTLTAQEAEEEWSRSRRAGGHTLALSCYECDRFKCSPLQEEQSGESLRRHAQATAPRGDRRG